MLKLLVRGHILRPRRLSHPSPFSTLPPNKRASVMLRSTPGVGRLPRRTSPQQHLLQEHRFLTQKFQSENISFLLIPILDPKQNPFDHHMVLPIWNFHLCNSRNSPQILTLCVGHEQFSPHLADSDQPRAENDVSWPAPGTVAREADSSGNFPCFEILTYLRYSRFIPHPHRA